MKNHSSDENGVDAHSAHLGAESPSAEALLTAILFSAGSVVAASKLRDFLRWDDKKLRESLDRAKAALAPAGLTIMEVAGGYKIVTVAELAPVLEKFFTRIRQSGLSKAALEAVSIIAYRQPCTRQEVEEIRGVNSDGVIRWLLERRLIKVKERIDSPGRPFAYVTTEKFMEVFGLKSLKDLPRVNLPSLESRHAPPLEDGGKAAPGVEE